MTTANKVVWYEGMFLLPQHMQQYDHYVESLIHQKQALVTANYWGFSNLKLDDNLLNLGKIAIEEASGLFPDGTYFDIPNRDFPPKPFDVPEGLKDTVIYLAIPLKQNGTADIGNENCGQPYRYNIINKRLKDTTAEAKTSSEIQLGTLAYRILTEHDDLSSYAALPIAKVIESRSNQQISLDKNFLSQWTDVQKIPPLKTFISEVHGLLQSRAKMLAGRLADTDHAGTADITDFMLLQLVNKYEPLFHHLQHKTPLHPEALFSTLIQLMGELASFTQDKRRPIEPPIYQHNDLYSSFQPIILNLRQALSRVLEQNALAIPLEQHEHGLWSGIIHDKQLLNSSQFILAVYADMPTDKLRVAFPSQVKIGPIEQINTLVSKALPGIPLNTIAVAPRQIPYHANYCYFILETRHASWQQMQTSGGLALHVASQIPGLTLELWAIKG